MYLKGADEESARHAFEKEYMSHEAVTQQRLPMP